jgi:hypothetical protein
MPEEINLISAPIPAANEGFTQGGDLILRTIDGVDFRVHSLFLSVASPVFSNLLKSESRKEVVCFSENAELTSLMLQFIYPRPTPTIASMKPPNDALRVANKYQLENMKSGLCEQMMMANSPVSAYNDPLAALHVAFTHNFTTGVELASSVVSKTYEFGTIDDLKKLLNTSPSPATAALLSLVGIPLIKTRVLTEALFRFNCSPMIITENLNSMMCSLCRAAFTNSAGRHQPEWQTRWASWIFDNIKSRPISDWKDFFNQSNIHKAFYQPHLSSQVLFYNDSGVGRGACTCMSLLLGPPHGTFRTWADGVYKNLESRLGFIMDLEGFKREGGGQ